MSGVEESDEFLLQSNKYVPYASYVCLVFLAFYCGFLFWLKGYTPHIKIRTVNIWYSGFAISQFLYTICLVYIALYLKENNENCFLYGLFLHIFNPVSLIAYVFVWLIFIFWTVIYIADIFDIFDYFKKRKEVKENTFLEVIELP